MFNFTKTTKTVLGMAVALAAAGLLAACSSAGGGAAADLNGTSWVLATLDGSPPVEGTELTISFADGEVTGSAGCNSFGGTYEVDGTTLVFSPLVSTMMACEDSINAQERAYLDALDTQVDFAINGSSLTLTGSNGSVLVFNAA